MILQEASLEEGITLESVAIHADEQLPHSVILQAYLPE